MSAYNGPPSLPPPADADAFRAGGLRFDRREWAAAYADLGTFIPFVVSYISVIGMEPGGILFAFGAALVCYGFLYRTPVPVQPMKAIGAVAAAHAVSIPGASVVAASMVTGAIWLLLGLTGTAGRLARAIPRSVVLGIMLGLGLSFMLQGLRMMSADWRIAAPALLVAVLFRRSRLFPAMIVLLAGGGAYGAISQPALWEQARFAFDFRLPALALHGMRWQDIATGALLLALPQVPLTLGNAVIGISEENNRLFPGRPASVKKVAITTGVMNLAGGLIGGVPMCHGAGGMAAYVAFGARTGGAPIIFGITLAILALCFGGSVVFLLQAVPVPVLGTILLLAGVQLAAGNVPRSRDWRVLWPVVLVACVAVWNVAAAFLAGWVVWWAMGRGRRKPC